MIVYSETETYTIRSLIPSDFSHGYKEVLSDLTVTGNLDLQLCLSVQSKHSSSSIIYKTIVIEEKPSRDIIGNGVLVSVPDLYHNGDLAGFIEDIVVLKRAQGKGYGYKIINTLNEIAKSLGCYKVCLDCDYSNELFYNKCGLEKNAIQLGIYLNR